MLGIWVIAGGGPLSRLVSKTKGGIFGPTLKYCFVIQVAVGRGVGDVAL